MGVGDNAAWLGGSQAEAVAAERCGNGSRDVGVIADDLEALADAVGGLLESFSGREAAPLGNYCWCRYSAHSCISWRRFSS